MKPSAETGSDEMFNRHKSSASPTRMTTRFCWSLLVLGWRTNSFRFLSFPNNHFFSLLIFLAGLFFHSCTLILLFQGYFLL